VVASAGAGSGSSLLSVEMRHLGGALARTTPGDGALSLADTGYAVFAVGVAPTPELAAVSDRDSQRVLDALRPWDAGRDYMNFREKRTSGQRLFSPTVYRRLQQIKAKVDPSDVIRSNHPVTASSSSA
jgi:hypothetical protein